MLCRALLATIAISYLVCVLILSGIQKEDLDVSLLRKLVRHNVDLNDPSWLEQCTNKTIEKGEDSSLADLLVKINLYQNISAQEKNAKNETATTEKFSDKIYKTNPRGSSTLKITTYNDNDSKNTTAIVDNAIKQNATDSPLTNGVSDENNGTEISKTRYSFSEKQLQLKLKSLDDIIKFWEKYMNNSQTTPQTVITSSVKTTSIETVIQSEETPISVTNKTKNTIQTTFTEVPKISRRQTVNSEDIISNNYITPSQKQAQDKTTKAPLNSLSIDPLQIEEKFELGLNAINKLNDNLALLQKNFQSHEICNKSKHNEETTKPKLGEGIVIFPRDSVVAMAENFKNDLPFNQNRRNMKSVINMLPDKQSTEKPTPNINISESPQKYIHQETAVDELHYPGENILSDTLTPLNQNYQYYSKDSTVQAPWNSREIKEQATNNGRDPSQLALREHKKHKLHNNKLIGTIDNLPFTASQYQNNTVLYNQTEVEQSNNKYFKTYQPYTSSENTAQSLPNSDVQLNNNAQASEYKNTFRAPRNQNNTLLYNPTAIMKENNGNMKSYPPYISIYNAAQRLTNSDEQITNNMQAIDYKHVITATQNQSNTMVYNRTEIELNKKSIFETYQKYIPKAKTAQMFPKITNSGEHIIDNAQVVQYKNVGDTLEHNNRQSYQPQLQENDNAIVRTIPQLGDTLEHNNRKLYQPRLQENDVTIVRNIPQVGDTLENNNRQSYQPQLHENDGAIVRNIPVGDILDANNRQSYQPQLQENDGAIVRNIPQVGDVLEHNNRKSYQPHLEENDVPIGRNIPQVGDTFEDNNRKSYHRQLQQNDDAIVRNIPEMGDTIEHNTRKSYQPHLRENDDPIVRNIPQVGDTHEHNNRQSYQPQLQQNDDAIVRNIPQVGDTLERNNRKSYQPQLQENVAIVRNIPQVSTYLELSDKRESNKDKRNLPSYMLHEIAESVKEIVLKDLKKEINPNFSIASTLSPISAIYQNPLNTMSPSAEISISTIAATTLRPFNKDMVSQINDSLSQAFERAANYSIVAPKLEHVNVTDTNMEQKLERVQEATQAIEKFLELFKKKASPKNTKEKKELLKSLGVDIPNIPRKTPGASQKPVVIHHYIAPQVPPSPGTTNLNPNLPVIKPTQFDQQAAPNYAPPALINTNVFGEIQPIRTPIAIPQSRNVVTPSKFKYARKPEELFEKHLDGYVNAKKPQYSALNYETAPWKSPKSNIFNQTNNNEDPKLAFLKYFYDYFVKENEDKENIKILARERGDYPARYADAFERSKFQSPEFQGNFESRLYQNRAGNDDENRVKEFGMRQYNINPVKNIYNREPEHIDQNLQYREKISQNYLNNVKNQDIFNENMFKSFGPPKMESNYYPENLINSGNRGPHQERDRVMYDQDLRYNQNHWEDEIPIGLSRKNMGQNRPLPLENSFPRVPTDSENINLETRAPNGLGFNKNTDGVLYSSDFEDEPYSQKSKYMGDIDDRNLDIGPGPRGFKDVVLQKRVGSQLGRYYDSNKAKQTSAERGPVGMSLFVDQPDTRYHNTPWFKSNKDKNDRWPEHKTKTSEIDSIDHYSNMNSNEAKYINRPRTPSYRAQAENSDEKTNSNKKPYYDSLTIKGFHSKLEGSDDGSNRSSKIIARHQEPLSRKSTKTQDTHFKNFLKTQRKVNQMLENILATKKD